LRLGANRSKHPLARLTILAELSIKGMPVGLTEADTCRLDITPRLIEAGWGNAPCVIGEQRQITDGRVLIINGKARRAQVRKPDYILYYRRDFPIAV
jgi:type I restriction enzyme R subunit